MTCFLALSSLNDWGNPLWDQRELSRDTRRVSETSESGEEGWAQSDQEGRREETEEDMDQDELVDSHNEDEEDNDSNVDDNGNDHGDEGGLILVDKTSCVDGHVGKATSIDAIPGFRDDREFAMLEGEEEGERQTEGGDSADEEAFDDWDDEEYVDYEDDDKDDKTLYHCFAYPTKVFQNLESFRHSSLFTDLTLSTQDGQSLHAHSPVVAAVSSLIQQKLRMKSKWSHSDILVCLGPDVTHLGLAAVLEFAYTGNIPTLCKDTIDYIQTAALALGAQRVLDLCKLKNEEDEKDKREKEEEDKKVKVTEKNGEKETNSLSAAEELEITLQSIRDLWVEKAGCDIVLQADERLFHAHRVVLAASSDYFRAMFTSGMRETRQWIVALHSLGDEELDAFLHCFYSGSLELSWGWVFDLVCAALQFQVEPALSLCLDFLQQEIDAHSCLDVASFAEAYGMWDLLQFADDFVLRHFQDVSTSPKFQHLPKDKLLRYLESNALCVPSEIVVLRAVMSWISANPNQRVRLASDLINMIKFPLLTFKEFSEAKSIARCSQQSMRNLYETMLEEFCSQEIDKESEFRDYLPKDNLVLVGGDGITSDMGNRKASRELWYSNALRNHTGIIKQVEWRFLGEIPETPRFCHEVAVLEDKLYVCGGRHFYGEMDIMKSMFRYDPFDNTWKRLADMQVERGQFSMVVLKGMIYVMGGDRLNISVDSVERYCPNTDSWSFVHPLDQPMSSHAALVWNGDIYVSGGYNCEYQCLVSMFRYHPERGTTYLADMPHSRAQHRMECVGDHLYVVGGLCDSSTLDDLSCQVYSPESDFWSSIPPVATPHVGAASAVLEDKVYILGGYSQMDYSDCNLIHRYDPVTECWENMGEMPGPTTEVRACRLSLPSHLRE
ncbi:kelch-like protein 33 [Sardina pilchardus]|uniref:kelch-like protein 33 n=1 Tax=Sardina pilchardus TaxID=27697 RepID=UPI002E0EDE60